MVEATLPPLVPHLAPTAKAMGVILNSSKKRKSTEQRFPSRIRLPQLIGPVWQLPCPHYASFVADRHRLARYSDYAFFSHSSFSWINGRVEICYIFDVSSHFICLLENGNCLSVRNPWLAWIVSPVSHVGSVLWWLCRGDRVHNSLVDASSVCAWSRILLLLCVSTVAYSRVFGVGFWLQSCCARYRIGA
jgi:hypothetical protein